MRNEEHFVFTHAERLIDRKSRPSTVSIPWLGVGAARVAVGGLSGSGILVEEMPRSCGRAALLVRRQLPYVPRGGVVSGQLEAARAGP